MLKYLTALLLSFTFSATNFGKAIDTDPENGVVDQPLPLPDRRFLIDFGNPTMLTTLSGWNNVNSSVVGTVVNLITSQGSTSALNIEIVNSSDDGYAGGGNQYNSQGYNGQLLDYPVSACNDSHFSYQTGGVYKLTGLAPDHFYTIRIFGSRAYTASDRVGAYTFNRKQKLLNASNNNSQTVVFYYLKPNAQGELTLDFGVATGSQFGYLNVMDVTETSAPGITAPGGLSAQLFTLNGVLNWADNSGNELGFRIERRLSSGNLFEVVAEVGANVTQYTDADLAPGNYEYRVYAFNATEESAYSNEVSLLVTEPVVGDRRFLIDFGDPLVTTTLSGWNNVSNSSNGTLVNLVSTSGSSSFIDIAVTQNPSNGYGGSGNQYNSAGYNGIVLDYPASACNDSHFSYASGGRYKLSGLNPQKFYSIRIFGSRSVAAADRKGTFTFNGKQMTLDASVNTAQTIIFHYLKPSAAGELILDFGVAPGSTFGYLNVMDINERTTPSINEPLSLQAAVNVQDVTLNWVDNSNNELGFKIERRVAGDALFTEVGQVGAGVTQFAETMPGNQAGYEYRVFAYKSDENSAYSNAVNAVPVLSNPPPAAPSNLQYSVDGYNVILNWVSGANTAGVRIERRIHNGTNGPFAQVGEVGQSIFEFVDAPTPIDQSFEYRVYAFNGNENSDYSPSVIIESIGYPSAEFLTLKALYDNLDGDNWINKNNWPATGNWPSLASNNLIATWEGIMMNGNHLNAITLENNNLSGVVPERLWDLKDIWFVRMTGNNITSFDQASNMTGLYNLYELDFSKNKLWRLPDNIGQLTNLSRLVLNDNQLEELPASMSNLAMLYEVILKNNELSSLPDFSASSILYSLDVSLNYLDFSAIEPLVQSGITSLTYAPQKNIPGMIYQINVGDYLEILSRDPGNHSTIVWEKRQPDGTWVNVNHLNEDASLTTFTKNVSEPGDEGRYRWRMTNSLVTGLTIQSDPITVQFTEPVNDEPVKKLYNGLITAAHWRTDHASGNTEDLTGMYSYTYDDRYQVADARWADDVNRTLGTFTRAGNKFRLTGMTYDPNGNILSLKRFNELGSYKHNFTYYYAYQQAGATAVRNNQLASVDGYVNSFTYNKIGQMTEQDKEINFGYGDENLNDKDQYVEYDVSGKVTRVYDAKNETTGGFEGLKVEYIYDDRGFRLAKVNFETERTTWYIRDASGNIISTYEEDGIPNYNSEGAPVESTNTLELTEVPVYGSGKLGIHYPGQNGSTVYEITDHLGNVRALMRDNANTYTATMEDTGEADFTNPRVEEMQYFENLFTTEDENVAMNHTPPGAVEASDKSAYLYWVDGMTGLEATDKAIGPAIALRVGTGDIIDIETWVKFERKADYNRDVLLTSLSSFLGSNFLGQTGFEGFTPGQIADNISGALLEAGYPNDGTEDESPFAYLNYILYDENMQFVDAGWKRVSDDAGFDPPERGIAGGHEHLKFDEPIPITQKGYIYIWVSNQSEETEVWFDDLTVNISGSYVTQATDYGVWGDVIREQKFDESKYRFGYQGQFAEKDHETGWSHFELREYDPVIGRWTSVDPYSQYWNSYLALGNDPLNMVDPDGGKAGPGGPFGWFKNLFGIGPKHVPVEKMKEDFSSYDLDDTVFDLDEVEITGDQEQVLESRSAAIDFFVGMRTKEIDGQNFSVDHNGYSTGFLLVEGDAPPIGPGGAMKATKILSHLHHSYPKFLGGLKNQKLTKMAVSAHKRLHKELNVYLKKFGMAPSKTNPGAKIRAQNSSTKIRQVLTDFYKGPGAKYTKAAKDFFEYIGH